MPVIRVRTPHGYTRYRTLEDAIKHAASVVSLHSRPCVITLPDGQRIEIKAAPLPPKRKAQ